MHLRTLLFPVLSNIALAAPHSNRTAQDIITLLSLQPNIEKGFFRETFADTHTVDGTRSASTAIYYLLEGSAGFSHWHRLDAVEIWHFYAGSPMTLELSWDNGTANQLVLLGDDIFDGQSLQGVVSANSWQRARSEGDWTLVGTTVAPGFVESGFEMRQDWMPDGGCREGL